MDVIDELADEAIGSAAAKTTTGFAQLEYLAGQVAEMMREMRVTERQGELLFLYSVMGAFAVNRALRRSKDETCYEMQRMILTYAHAGNEALKKRTKK